MVATRTFIVFCKFIGAKMGGDLHGDVGDELLRKREALRHSRTQRDRARALLELDDTLGRARELALSASPRTERTPSKA